MESRSRVGALVAIVVFALATLPGRADAFRDGAHADTDGDGVDIVFTRYEGGVAIARSTRGGCDWHAMAFEGTSPTHPEIPEGLGGVSPGPEFHLYLVWCGSNAAVARWLGPRNFVADTQPVVDELLRRVTVLPAGMRVRPDNRGVTGIGSYFWVEGYGGAPLQATESAFGLTVTVTAQLVGVEWDFGDGTPVVSGGLGEAWPQRSSVQHTYRNPSGAQPYAVTARLLLQPSYTVDGAGGEPLGPIVVPVSRPYVVHEVQAERRS